MSGNVTLEGEPCRPVQTSTQKDAQSAIPSAQSDGLIVRVGGQGEKNLNTTGTQPLSHHLQQEMAGRGVVNAQHNEDGAGVQDLTFEGEEERNEKLRGTAPLSKMFDLSHSRHNGGLCQSLVLDSKQDSSGVLCETLALELEERRTLPRGHVWGSGDSRGERGTRLCVTIAREFGEIEGEGKR